MKFHQPIVQYSYVVIVLILSIAACTTPTSKVANENKPTDSRPNILFILADDLGWNEVGYNSETIKYTPNIDQLRESGVSLTQFYVHAVCTPSRAAFITGRYPFRTWSDWRPEDFGKPSYLEMLDMKLVKNEEGDETRRIHALPTEERTVAEALQEVGYFTSISGKWGCGEWLLEHLPLGQGFMHQYGHYAWGLDYNNYTIPHNAPAKFAVYDWHRNQEPLHEQGYSTDLIANEVVRLLATQKQQHPNQPFFYYVPFNAIHGPLEDTPRHAKLGKRYAALKCFDDAVGRILGAIDQYGFKENTLVVFANDNGAIRDSMNAPYRGTKNTNYEGGVRAPCILSWPNKIKPNSTNNTLTHITDFYSTFIKLGGGSLIQKRAIDGFDLTNVLLNGKQSERTEIVYEVAGSVRPPAIRQGDYKLVGEELFNIKEDPYEANNLANTQPEILRALKERVATIGKERPPMPSMDLLMTPALPWVYGQQENASAPEWVKEQMRKIRAKQPQKWATGTTPWPQAPKNGKIIYTGDGR